jgi:hypothetical protein
MGTVLRPAGLLVFSLASLASFAVSISLANAGPPLTPTLSSRSLCLIDNIKLPSFSSEFSSYAQALAFLRNVDAHKHSFSSATDTLSFLLKNSALFRESVAALPSSQVPAWKALGRRLIHGDNKVERAEETIVSGLNASFSKLLDPQSLEIRREEALGRSLQARGVTIEAGGARKTLEALSDRNFKRLLSVHDVETYRKGGLDALEEMKVPEIRTAVSNVQLHFLHNSTHSRFSGGILLSSQDVRLLGLSGGHNSMSDFNESFLKSDGDVFFHLIFGRKEGPILGQDEVKKITRYGEVAITPKPDVAEQVGWVSWFVMMPGDLESFAGKLLKTNLPKRSNYKNVSIAYRMDDTAQAWKDARDQLNRTDFTLPDFRAIVQIQLARSLAKLKTESPDRYLKALSHLQTNSGDDFSNTIRELALDPLGLDRMEFKIPSGLAFKEINTIPVGQTH